MLIRFYHISIDFLKNKNKFYASGFNYGTALYGDRGSRKIKSLQSCTFLKAEYQCEQCSYMICRSITKPEIELMLKENRIIEPLYCPTCDTESVQLIEVYSEEDWYRRYPDYMQGG